MTNLGRFRLQDLGLLVMLVVWFVVPKPDSEARASLVTLRQEQREAVRTLEDKKVNKETAEVQYKALSDKIDTLTSEVKTLSEKLDKKTP